MKNLFYVLVIVFFGCSSSGTKNEPSRDEVVAHLQKSCESGDQFACSEAATRTFPFELNESKKKELLSIYKKSCDAGFGLSCSRLAKLKMEYGRSDAEADFKKAVELDPLVEREQLGAFELQRGNLQSAGSYFDSDCQQFSDRICWFSGIAALWSGKKAKAMSDFKKACFTTSVYGCRELGNEHLLKNEMNQAQKYYQMACDSGDMMSCRLLKGESQKVWSSNCQKGGYSDCYFLGLDYFGRGKIKEAKEKYEFACDHKIGAACTRAAQLEADEVKSQKLNELGCALGSGFSCSRLPLQEQKEMAVKYPDFYLNHIGELELWGIADFISLLKKFGQTGYAEILSKKLCEENPFYCYDYASGHFQQNNLKEAIAFWDQACKKGNRDSCREMNLELMNTNKNLGKEENKKLCESGYLFACSDVGYDNDLDNNLESAKYYYLLACRFGEKTSCYNYGSIMASFKNDQEAKKFFQRSCYFGYDKACLKL